MNGPAVEILLVEDSDTDLELALRALAQANRIEVARDGAEALDFLFSQGAFAGRAADNPRVPGRRGRGAGSCSHPPPARQGAARAGGR